MYHDHVDGTRLILASVDFVASVQNHLPLVDGESPDRFSSCALKPPQAINKWVRSDQFLDSGTRMKGVFKVFIH